MFAYQTYSANQAADIAGVNTTLQRAWRTRGFIPQVEGKAKFALFDLARLMVLRALTSHHLRADVSDEQIELMTGSVMYHCLGYRRVYSGDIVRHFPDLSGLFRKFVDQSFSAEMALDYWKTNGLRQQALTTVAHKQSRLAYYIPAQGLAWAEDMLSIEVMSSASPTLFLEGAVLIDVGAMGSVLASRAQGSCRVELPQDMLSDDPLADLHDIDALFARAAELFESGHNNEQA